jgi:hypothetical protein
MLQRVVVMPRTHGKMQNHCRDEAPSNLARPGQRAAIASREAFGLIVRLARTGGRKQLLRDAVDAVAGR